MPANDKLTELNYSTPFELLVAVTLSAQATDKSVNKVTDELFPLANTPETIYELAVVGSGIFFNNLLNISLRVSAFIFCTPPNSAQHYT
jgi:hypothetical protein